MCLKRLFKAIYTRYISHDLGSLLFHNLEVAMNYRYRFRIFNMKNRRKIYCREVSKKLLLSCKGDKTQDDLQ